MYHFLFSMNKKIFEQNLKNINRGGFRKKNEK
jgi:hypothetical protein